jgi:hypothetical protein
LILFFSVGCAGGKFGKADVDFFNIKQPAGIVGQTSLSVLNSLGNPDHSVSVGDTEYWGYKNHNGTSKTYRNYYRQTLTIFSKERT